LKTPSPSTQNQSAGSAESVTGLRRIFSDFAADDDRAVRAVEDQNKILRFSAATKALESRIALAKQRGKPEEEIQELENRLDKHLEDGIPE
jgi:hypothetical protein